MNEKLELLKWLKINGHLYSDVANIDYLLECFENSKNKTIIKSRQEIDQMIYDLSVLKFKVITDYLIESIESQIETLTYRYSIDEIEEQGWSKYSKNSANLILKWMYGEVDDYYITNIYKI
jgi:hypothetical protein